MSNVSHFTCGAPQVKCETLDNAVITTLIDEVLTEANVDKMVSVIRHKKFMQSKDNATTNLKKQLDSGNHHVSYKEIGIDNQGCAS